jgi:hypothetical protein
MALIQYPTALSTPFFDSTNTSEGEGDDDDTITSPPFIQFSPPTFFSDHQMEQSFEMLRECEERE